jgi:hypothetical protein
VRRAEDGTEQQSAQRLSQAPVYRSRVIHRGVMRHKLKKVLR